MIKEIVERFMAAKPELEARLAEHHVAHYSELVKLVIKAINPSNDYFFPDPNRITEIDHGNYGGTLVYVIGETGYQPSTYWYVQIDYGSCPACDTLESIGGYSDDAPTPEEVKQYMILALHIVQGMKVME